MYNNNNSRIGSTLEHHDIGERPTIIVILFDYYAYRHVYTVYSIQYTAHQNHSAVEVIFFIYLITAHYNLYTQIGPATIRIEEVV